MEYKDRLIMLQDMFRTALLTCLGCQIKDILVEFVESTGVFLEQTFLVINSNIVFSTIIKFSFWLSSVLFALHNST